MNNQERFRESDLGRAKTKRSFLHQITNIGLKRHRSDTGLVEDRTSSVTIVRIIVGLLMIHLIIIGGVLLRGQMVKDNSSAAATSTPLAPPPSPITQPHTAPVREALPQPAVAPAAPARTTLSANHITQSAQEDDTAAEDPEAETVIITPPSPVVQHTPAKPIAAAEPLRHLVAPGDTIYRISNQYGITEAALKAANPALNQGVLRSGTTLVIPVGGQYSAPAAPVTPVAAPRPAAPQPQQTSTASAPTSSPKVYTVQRGETLSRISRKVKVSVKELMEINGLKNPNRITPGMELRLSR